MVTETGTGSEPGRVILLAVLPAAIIVGFLFFPAVSRAVLGISLVLFVPGFALVYALFNDEEIDDIERVALSIGLSICVVIFDGLFLNYTPWGLKLLPIVVSLVAITGAFTAIGYFRRRV